jgi:hypothetical protein
MKLYTFRAFSLPIIRSFLLYFGTGKFHAVFDDSYLAAPGWNSLGNGQQNLHELTSAECTLENS